MKDNQLTIIMYHYVRPIASSNFQGIKGLELDAFKRQLDFLEENYNLVSSKQVIEAFIKRTSLPPNACWLTFDDGYKDHYRYVFPELRNRGLSGAFFPPSHAISKNKMLDVNSVHHILSSTTNLNKLIRELNDECYQYGISRQRIKLYYEEFAVENRFDNKNVIYFKRMLQHALPKEIRTDITSNLFKKYVGVSETEFAKDLYMSVPEIQEMHSQGMHFGSHGEKHHWLDGLNYNQQRDDISASLDFLVEIGVQEDNWIMCYPYGAYNSDTILVLKELGASLAITTKVGIVDLFNNDPLLLPRMDTNDFPS